MSINEIMLEFTRSAVLGRTPVVGIKEGIDWDRLMDLSTDQGLLAWVWDGICKLPAEQQPSRQQRINWGLSAQNIWDGYSKHKIVLQNMIDVCGRNNMRLLLLKGIGLSMLYPVPQSRPSGDIDVYFFNDYEKGNALFCQGDYIFGVGGKHSEFTYEGVHVENHLTMINTLTKKQRQAERFIENTLNDVRKTELGYYVLPPIGNLVYLLMHSLSHMDSIYLLPYRSIIDFGMFLEAHRADLTPETCHRVMDELELSGSFELLIHLVECLLGVSFQDYYRGIVSQKDIEKAMQMLEQRDAKLNDDISPFIKREFLLIKRSFQTRWLYKYLPQSSKERVTSELRREMSVLFRKTFSVPENMLVKDFIKYGKQKTTN